MALYVVPVAQPAAGHDWQVTVPGQYLWDVVAVSATLGTGASGSKFVDSTATHNDLTVVGNQAHYTGGATGPYAGPPGDFSIAGDGNNAGTSTYARGSSIAGYGAVNMSVEFLAQAAANGFNNQTICGLGHGAGSPPFFVWLNQITGTTYEPRIAVSGTIRPGAGVAHTFGGWHHHAITYDGTKWNYYYDGVLAGSSAAAAGGPGAVTDSPEMPGGSSNGIINGNVAGVAFYASTLAAGDIATHAAALPSAAAYKSAVLASSPAGLWLLNDNGQGPSRVVDLVVTDGTHTLDDIPTGLTTIANGGPYVYSWQPTLNSSASTPDGTSVAVAIPKLVLPAGYTIGTRTLDLAGTDQWSNINVWWSDDFQNGVTGATAYEFPGGILLRYQQEGAIA